MCQRLRQTATRLSFQNNYASLSMHELGREELELVVDRDLNGQGLFIALFH